MAGKYEMEMRDEMQRAVDGALFSAEHPLLSKLKWPLIILAGVGVGFVVAASAHFGLSQTSAALESFKYNIPTEVIIGLSALSGILTAGTACACAHDRTAYL